MKKFVLVLVVLALVVPADAAWVEGTQVMYVGGSVPNLPEGTMGTLNTQREDALVFEYKEGKLEIPYRNIQSFQYSERVAHRMGVIPTIAVVLVKRRQRRHFIEVAFRNADGASQAVVLEVSKGMAQPVTAVLEARSPKLCTSQSGGNLQGTAARLQATTPCRVPHVSAYSD